MIAAVNGPALIHAELAVLCDIVIASPNAAFRSKPSSCRRRSSAITGISHASADQT
jgi:hypothetical protein